MLSTPRLSLPADRKPGDARPVFHWDARYRSAVVQFDGRLLIVTLTAPSGKRNGQWEEQWNVVEDGRVIASLPSASPQLRPWRDTELWIHIRRALETVTARVAIRPPAPPRPLPASLPFAPSTVVSKEQYRLRRPYLLKRRAPRRDLELAVGFAVVVGEAPGRQWLVADAATGETLKAFSTDAGRAAWLRAWAEPDGARPY